MKGFDELISRDGPKENTAYPEDCGLPADSLRRVYETVLEVPLVCLPGDQTRCNVLLTLLTYCYARGWYSSEQIEASTATDRTLRYIVANDLPPAARIRSFRRLHKPALVHALSLFFAKAFPHESEPTAEAGAEALNRVQRAIQRDSIELDV